MPRLSPWACTERHPILLSGIYQISAPTGAAYIGSSRRLDLRKAQHLTGLRNGKHPNVILQRAWDKYGSLDFKVLLHCREEDLLFYEQRCIDGLNSEYNISRIAGQVEFTPEVRAKLSAWKRSPETREKMRQAKLGKKRSPEHCAKLSAGMKGKKKSPEHIAKIKATQLAKAEFYRAASRKRWGL